MAKSHLLYGPPKRLRRSAPTQENIYLQRPAAGVTVWRRESDKSLHCTRSPAILVASGSSWTDEQGRVWNGPAQYWLRGGVLHRSEGPAVCLDYGAAWLGPDGSSIDGPAQVWLEHGQIGRPDNEPAVIIGSKEGAWGQIQGLDWGFLGPLEVYYRQGRAERRSGPAIEGPGGVEAWLISGLLHRRGGPAVTLRDGSTQHWEQGRKISLDNPNTRPLD